ncbi:BZ3500_MvSof-1268-A1-R1_Chr1-3g01870 [Microbotryum saponariae]|uniref:BZ3500_MvSof-1268-A1-R1_Chr1-3g01870 protein n=1 Tax=Microbotryum saponariae TaxID=289078 RepID=A0A2X0KVF8_9BASI|nr:BZ3500_MvSof-1268-A1-R1_Chr1-3g01870 [Microbotryum saponariae]SCZ94777.1 BZ3501_MvSof-1269-A2-R1_Chr1-3g01472 [Microbotryum saponariae]
MGAERPPTLRNLSIPDVAILPKGQSNEPGEKSAVLSVDLTNPFAAAAPNKHNPFANRGQQFWLVYLALCMSSFLSALDLTAVSTALPSMAAEFQSSEFSWVGSAYALTSTALIPWTGNLASIFGRRSTLLASLVLFALGSALVGAARSMTMVIAGRSIQGIGGGGILTMTEIVVVDLVPLADRGAFFGVIGSVWAVASAIGPPIGGALASAGAWRWLFYMNIPLAGIAFVLVAFFLRIKAPETTLKEKLEQMDYLNIVFVIGATFTIIGLTWGGVAHPWTSYQVLVPLILGFTTMGVFLWLEKSYVKYPTIPFDILSHRTSLLGFVTTFLHGIVSLAAVYYLTVFFQAAKGASPVQAGVDTFSLSFTVAPLSIITGVVIGYQGVYKAWNVLGWALTAIGFGITALMKFDCSKAASVGLPILMGLGLGILYSSTNFPVLAPLKASQQPHAVSLEQLGTSTHTPTIQSDPSSFPQMAFFSFMRAFGEVFGISIGATILQNSLAANLPREFLALFHGEAEIAFSAIPKIVDLHVNPLYSLRGDAEPLRSQVREAFALSLRVIWLTMVFISGLGFLFSLFIQDIELTTETDDQWGLHDGKSAPKVGDEEQK